MYYEYFLAIEYCTNIYLVNLLKSSVDGILPVLQIHLTISNSSAVKLVKQKHKSVFEKILAQFRGEFWNVLGT
jgi:hypothetical protein